MSNRSPGSPRAIRVFIVDPHPLVREGLRALLEAEPDLTTAGVAGSLVETVEGLATTGADVVITDLHLDAAASGLDLARELVGRNGNPGVLVYSVHDDLLWAERALRAGARGFVRTTEPVATILEAIRTVAVGRTWVSPAVATRVLQGVGGQRVAGGSPIDQLSDREVEVFGLIGRGYGTRDIASRLSLSMKTVATYRAHIKRKLVLGSATDLLRHAIAWAGSGLVDGRGSSPVAPVS